MRILITGGAGFIGKSLILKLLSSSENLVFNIDKLGYSSSIEPINSFCSKNDNNNHIFINLDLKNKKQTNDVIQDCSPDIIFHLAAESHVDRSITNPKEFIESNILGTYNLLEASLNYFRKLDNIKKNKFRFLHISTDEVFGSLGENGNFSEFSPYDPRSPYSASKASSDHLVKAWFHTFKLPVIVSNCSNNYGPWQFPDKFIPKVICNALSDEEIPIYGNGLNVRDWLYVEDHVNALILLSKFGRLGESYCIGGNMEKSNNDVALEICKILDKRFPNKKPHNKLIRYINDRPGHDKRYSINFQKIKTLHHWEPKYDFKKGLKNTINWYISNFSWVENIYKKESK